MPILILLCVGAALLGSVAPRFWKSRPLLAVVLVVSLPVLALYVRYATFARANDWEGMGALAFAAAGIVWMVVGFAAGIISIRLRRDAR